MSGLNASVLIFLRNGRHYKFHDPLLGTVVKITATRSIVVVLTALNFDEIVLDVTKDVLVQFYAPGCGHCKAIAHIYEKLAKVFKLEQDVVSANLDVDKYKSLAEKYDVSTGYFTLKVFPKSNKTSESYDSGRDLGGFVDFINEKSGTYRDGEGKLTSKAGLVATLDKLVKEFLNAGSEEKKAIFVEIEEEVGKPKGSATRYGIIYLKAARNFLDKGAEYVKNEIQRLERMLEKSISPSKADEFTFKRNILSSFS